MATTHAQPDRRRGFASDNASGIHPAILEAIARANDGNQYPGYGNDPITNRAIGLFKQTFGSEDISVHFVYSGTAANVLGIGSVCLPFQSVLCAETAHYHIDECGAPEKHTGIKTIPIPSSDGKITPEQILQYTPDGDCHHVQARVVSITQCTEYGTVYSIAEIKAIAEVAHTHGMLLHMDGARLSNAAASLGVSLKEITVDCGVDMLSFGGTKNGLMGAEAIVFFKPELAQHFKFYHKQGMQLASKMRFLAAQLEALLVNDLWCQNASHANKMAELLHQALLRFPQVKITQKRMANSVFATLPRKWTEYLQEEFYFYVWNEKTGEVRLMCGYDTEERDVRAFIERLQAAAVNFPEERTKTDQAINKNQ